MLYNRIKERTTLFRFEFWFRFIQRTLQEHYTSTIFPTRTSYRDCLPKETQSQNHFMADSESVCLGVEPTLWTNDQILLPFQEFGSGICCPVSVGRPLRREAGSVLCKSRASHLSVCTFTIYILVFHTFTTHIQNKRMYVCVCTSITLERLERFQPNLVHI
jgi:hypothetical protein